MMKTAYSRVALRVTCAMVLAAMMSLLAGCVPSREWKTKQDNLDGAKDVETYLSKVWSNPKINELGYSAFGDEVQGVWKVRGESARAHKIVFSDSESSELEAENHSAFVFYTRHEYADQSQILKGAPFGLRRIIKRNEKNIFSLPYELIVFDANLHARRAGKIAFGTIDGDKFVKEYERTCFLTTVGGMATLVVYDDATTIAIKSDAGNQIFKPSQFQFLPVTVVWGESGERVMYLANEVSAKRHYEAFEYVRE